MKNKKDIDIEYLVESIAQKRYFAKANTLRYDELKSIAEDEVIYYIENEADTLREMRNRISFRYRHKLTYIPMFEHSIWNGWRENPYFISGYENELKRGRRFNRLISR